MAFHARSLLLFSLTLRYELQYSRILIHRECFENSEVSEGSKVLRGIYVGGLRKMGSTGGKAPEHRRKVTMKTGRAH